MPRASAFFQNPFVLDVRALGLMRIALAAVLLTDLAIRSTDLEAHYANMGVLPLHALFANCWTPYQFSLHTISGLWQVQALLFLIAAGVAGALLLGYHTRLMTVLSWLLLVSVQNRNPLISQGGDDLLRMLLFWGIFLPWGRCYSLDARHKPLPASFSYFSAATVAYMVQLAMLYWCTALLKSGPEWTQEGTALYYALSLDQILMPVGRLLYPYGELLRVLTFGAYYTEMLLPFVLFIPFRVAWWRMVFITVLLLFHIGISLTLFVGLFYLINIASLLGLLPAAALAVLERRVLPPLQRLQQRAAENTAAWRARLTAWPRPFRLQVSAAWHGSGSSRQLVRSLREGLVLGLLVYICWWNADSVAPTRRLFSDQSRWLAYLVRLDQHWGMFAPTVFKDDGWYILEATTATGQHLDLNRHGAPVSYAKPASVVSLFANDRWRKYSENYLFIQNAYMRPYYCNYMLRIWQEKLPHTPIRQLAVVYMKEVSLPNYQVARPTREVLCTCAPAVPTKP
ncbi:HTTM domain-containing protein [Hymenobacter sp. BT730]|uniref:HTTM domain-containing protein n=1 Tax=Hymenobacter sp. BT730 TaxID=3063332 RepID=UPI0026DECF39|nr:HTTM domain-containing protein [Hymenobacter sp. BT730]